MDRPAHVDRGLKAIPGRGDVYSSRARWTVAGGARESHTRLS